MERGGVSREGTSSNASQQLEDLESEKQDLRKRKVVHLSGSHMSWLVLEKGSRNSSELGDHKEDGTIQKEEKASNIMAGGP